MKSLAIYVKLIFWPDYLYMARTVDISRGLWDWYVIGGVSLLVGIMFSVVRYAKYNKVMLFGLGWVVVASAPTVYTFPMQGILYEHWLYPVLPGIFVVIAFSVEGVLNRLRSEHAKYGLIVIVTCSVLALSVRTIARNRDWVNPINFYEKNIFLGGDSVIVSGNLGMEYALIGRYNKAIEYYERAIRMDEKAFLSWYNMARAFQDKGNEEKALLFYNESIKGSPGFLPAYKNSAVIYESRGEHNKAVEILNKFLEVSPNNIDALFNIAIAYYESGNIELAKMSIRRILEIDPGNKQAEWLLAD